MQHISTFARPDGGGAWAYSFTQEWPFRGMRHQLSYTVPVLHDEADGHRPRRHRAQLPLPARRARRRLGLYVAPRATLLLPTGSECSGRGAGGVGFQANLPVSIRRRPPAWRSTPMPAPPDPSAKNPPGARPPRGRQPRRQRDLAAASDRSTSWSSSCGYSTEDSWSPEDGTSGTTSGCSTPASAGPSISPSGLQIVPGVAYTVGSGRRRRRATVCSSTSASSTPSGASIHAVRPEFRFSSGTRTPRARPWVHRPCPSARASVLLCALRPSVVIFRHAHCILRRACRLAIRVSQCLPLPPSSPPSPSSGVSPTSSASVSATPPARNGPRFDARARATVGAIYEPRPDPAQITKDERHVRLHLPDLADAARGARPGGPLRRRPRARRHPVRQPPSTALDRTAFGYQAYRLGRHRVGVLADLPRRESLPPGHRGHHHRRQRRLPAVHHAAQGRGAAAGCGGDAVRRRPAPDDLRRAAARGRAHRRRGLGASASCSPCSPAPPPTPTTGGSSIPRSCSR